MLQMQNQTPLAASMTVLPDNEGIDTLFVVVKATLTLPALQLAETQAPVTQADEYAGEPGASSVKAASEIHVGKPGTDVVLIGQAHAPNGRPVDEMYVALDVAERRTVALISGERQWKGAFGGFTPPQPFVSMPLVWERSFGGTVRQPDGRILAEDRNPVGRGFPGKLSPREVQGHPLPNIEDPHRPLANFGETPAPAGFGFVAPNWLPRRSLAGTYDSAWQESRAPYLPRDFDPRFLNVAPGAMAFDRFLAGGEPVTVNGAWRGGVLKFQIPATKPQAVATISGAERPLAMHLDTVLIEPDEGRLCLSWRASTPIGKSVLGVESVEITL